MCNLYSPYPKEDVERYIRKMLRKGVLPDYSPNPVGPFGTGLFIRPDGDALRGDLGQWGLIRPNQPERIDYIKPKPMPGRKPPAPRPRSTNNARVEGIESKPTFSAAWRNGQRCLVPAAWYAEPNWETGKNIWWHLKRADGLPWFLAGLWSEWTDPQTGEVIPSFTMITCNCDGHTLLGRLHKPERDLPPDAQDKRSLVHVDLDHWHQWLQGTESEAHSLITPPPAIVFDQTDAQRTDAVLAGAAESGSLF
jgi:putative SOS response-associated peptidase YedK